MHWAVWWFPPTHNCNHCLPKQELGLLYGFTKYSFTVWKKTFAEEGTYGNEGDKKVVTVDILETALFLELFFNAYWNIVLLCNIIHGPGTDLNANVTRVCVTPGAQSSRYNWQQQVGDCVVTSSCICVCVCVFVFECNKMGTDSMGDAVVGEKNSTS